MAVQTFTRPDERTSYNGYQATMLDSRRHDERTATLWGVLDPSERKGVIVEALRRAAIRGQVVDISVRGLYEAGSGAQRLAFQQGIREPLGRTVLKVIGTLPQIALTGLQVGEASSRYRDVAVDNHFQCELDPTSTDALLDEELRMQEFEKEMATDTAQAYMELATNMPSVARRYDLVLPSYRLETVE
jgi:hypothetical protein